MIRVLYFAVLREQAGRESEQLDAAGRSAAQVYASLVAQRALQLDRNRVRAAINGEFAAWDTLLADGDELALLPPVSGG